MLGLLQTNVHPLGEIGWKVGIPCPVSMGGLVVSPLPPLENALTSSSVSKPLGVGLFSGRPIARRANRAKEGQGTDHAGAAEGAKGMAGGRQGGEAALGGRGGLSSAGGQLGASQGWDRGQWASSVG